ncbi:MAG: endolytic transglycosylase MltG [Blautia sp.]|nr:endolytic transglycosylase MltG [Blautia sp.]
MRFKFYLRGCGLGMILAAIVLAVGFHKENSGRMSDDEVIQRALELGMVMQEDENPTEKEPETPQDTQTLAALPTESEKSGAANPAAAATEAGSEDTEDSGRKNTGKKDTDTKDTDKEDTDKKNTDKKDTGTKDTDKKNTDDKDADKKNTDKKDGSEENSEPDEPRTVTIEVKRGDVCRVIAEKLYEEGVVADAEEFRIYMKDHGYASLIQVGTFTFTTDMDYKEIAEILTNREK